MKIIRFGSQEFIPASHEDPKDPGVLKKVLLARDDIINGRVQMINWAILPVGKTFVPHFHEDMDEIFIHISGNAVLTVNKEEIEMKKGDCIVVKMREVHTMHNTGETDVEYVVVGVSRNLGGITVSSPDS